jgi:hypothetical protein
MDVGLLMSVEVPRRIERVRKCTAATFRRYALGRLVVGSVAELVVPNWRRALDQRKASKIRCPYSVLIEQGKKRWTKRLLHTIVILKVLRPTDRAFEWSMYVSLTGCNEPERYKHDIPPRAAEIQDFQQQLPAVHSS